MNVRSGKSLAPFGRLVGAMAVFAVGFGALAKSQEPEIPDGEGKEVVVKMCGGQCHGLTAVVSNQFTKEQWEFSVRDMIARGAEGTDEDVEKAVAYLVKYFGRPPAKKDGAKSVASERATQTSFEPRAALVCHTSPTSVHSGRRTPGSAH